MPAATAAASRHSTPRERLGSCGLSHRSECRFVARRAERELVQIGLADDARRRLRAGASRRSRRPAPICPARTRDAAVVGEPLTSIRSLTEIVRPCSGPRDRALAQLFVEHARLRHRLGLEDRDERVQRRIELCDAGERVADDPRRPDRPRRYGSPFVMSTPLARAVFRAVGRDRQIGRRRRRSRRTVPRACTASAAGRRR